MKSIITALFVTLLAATQAFAGSVKLTGKITNRLSDSIFAIYNTQRIGYEQLVIGQKLNADGAFELNIPVVEEYTFVLLQHGDQ